ncbi:MAG: PD-(D/E)XK nuclease domain-containing protein, partial [Kiritimatiellia bacterium]
EAQGLAEIERWYDGYRFHPAAERVINPVSLGCCLESTELRNYWSMTAMTTFLMDTLKVKPLNFAKVDVDESVLGTYEPDRADLTTLLFQTGYLTIKDFRWLGRRRLYTLGFPNAEVEDSFVTQLAPAYTGQPEDFSLTAQANAAKALYAHDVPGFLKILKGFFANIPYDLTDRQNEQMWQAIVYVILKSIGVAVSAEVRTNEGRIDMTAEVPNHCYVIEFKLDTSAAAAIAQIKENHYAEKFAGNGKTLTLIGLAFSKEKRTIVDSAIEAVKA